MREQNIIFFPSNKNQKPFVYNPKTGTLINKQKQNKIEKTPKKKCVVIIK